MIQAFLFLLESRILQNNIAAIAKLETQEDAIIIAQNEIAYLDDMSLEGDTDDNVSNIREVVKKALFTSS
jgi:hypothetical protein